ncbi:MAG: LysR family transcriptional regulator [Treponema sp.]|jgi:LysR family hydrogen peroxide-inducible transcriptional activator|nr:LysR family transcriptional regulator [Treponema sp.]
MEHLGYFMSIAKGSSFLDVALDHEISQATLSKSIIKLEDELGVRLLDRSHYPVTLTEAGRQFYEDLQKLLPGYKTMLDHIKAFVLRHDVSCTVIPSFHIFGIQVTLDQFSAVHQDIPLDTTRHDDSVSILTALQNEELDFGIMHKPLQPAPEIAMVALAADPLYVLLPKNHPAAKGETVSLYDVINDTFVANPWAYTILRDLVHVVPEMPKNIKKLEVRALVIESISDGFGVSILYHSDLTTFNLENIIIRPLAELPNNPLVLAWSKQKQLSPQQRTFRDYIIASFRK